MTSTTHCPKRAWSAVLPVTVPVVVRDITSFYFETLIPLGDFEDLRGWP